MVDALQFEVLDVFTVTPFQGNPLAVVLGGEGLSTAQMQSLAREFHLSETAFPFAPTPDEQARGVHYRLRIFTPEVELPFAGHPSVGAAWLLHTLGRVPAGTVVQACGAGDLAVQVSPDGGPVELTGGTPTLGEEVDAKPFLAAVGLDESDLVGLPPRTAGTGVEFCYVAVSPDAVGRAVPDAGRLGSLRIPGMNLAGVCLFAWPEGEADNGRDGDTAVTSERPVRARVFAADIGVTEDPATGSAGLGLAVYAVATGLLPGQGRSDFVVSQGVEMGRPSTLRCGVDAADDRAERATVAGDVVRVSSGTIAVPPAATGSATTPVEDAGETVSEDVAEQPVADSGAGGEGVVDSRTAAQQTMARRARGKGPAAKRRRR